MHSKGFESLLYRKAAVMRRARKADGSAEYHCSAGKNIYSRHQLMCLKEAEKQVKDEIKIKYHES